MCSWHVVYSPGTVIPLLRNTHNYGTLRCNFVNIYLLWTLPMTKLFLGCNLNCFLAILVNWTLFDRYNATFEAILCAPRKESCSVIVGYRFDSPQLWNTLILLIKREKHFHSCNSKYIMLEFRWIYQLNNNFICIYLFQSKYLQFLVVEEKGVPQLWETVVNVFLKKILIQCMTFGQTNSGTERQYNKHPFAVYCKSFRLLVDLLLMFKHRATSKVFRNGGLTVYKIFIVYFAPY